MMQQGRIKSLEENTKAAQITKAQNFSYTLNLKDPKSCRGKPKIQRLTDSLRITILQCSFNNTRQAHSNHTL